MPSPPSTPPRRLSPARASLAAGNSIPSRNGSTSSFPVASHGGGADPWENETAVRGFRGTRSNSSSPHKPTLGLGDDVPFVDLLPPNHRLPPRPSDLNEPAVTPQASRETSPSRLSSLASPLARIATVKHARSLSSPMGFTAESGGSPRPSAANLLATIFKTPETTPQSSSTSERKSFFRFSLPSSPTPSPRMPKATPNSTDIIDEFAGISFSTVLQSYLEEPTQTLSTPAEALKRTPGGRLEDAVATATDLLDRVYTAYRARTSSLGDIIGEIDAQREEIASHKILNENLRAQLDRVVTKEQEASEAQTDRLNEQERRLKDLEAELSQERRKREAVEEELWLARRSKCKRTSAGSDSGFESDVDSILSRSDMRGSIIISPAEDADEAGSEMGHDCESCHHQAAAVGAETKSPTPLRETWRPENLTVSKPGVWGFFKGRQQQTQQQQNWDTRYSGDAETVRAENRWLRERVRELEKAVEGALDAIAGRGI